MNILSKICRLIVFGVLPAFLLNATCETDDKERNSKEKILTLLYGAEDTKQKNRNLYEPNNDLSSAKCVGNGFESYVYPKADLDFYTFTIRSGSLKLYISDLETLGNKKNSGFLIYDETGTLIYDLSQRSFDGTNSAIIVNRYMNPSECTVTACKGLEKYRYIEFSPTKLRFYIKIHSLNPEIYFEGQQLESVNMHSFYNPTNLIYSTFIFLQGDFAACL